ncbi:hypothetical protein [Tissierella praeacuta]|uniref:hypothetical protein n=1 Tax=Tissierella praeacuta TaxID=43131 RepID=UPI002FDB7B96
MPKINFKVEGMEQLQKSFKKLGQVPQRHVTNSVRKAMRIPLNKAKGDAPIRTGALVKGMIDVRENSSKKAKSVRRIVFDRNMNDIFQKPNKEGKITGYYPVSQEYGFFAKNGRYIPGFRFISDSFIESKLQIEKTIVAEMQKRMDVEIVKAGLK